MTRLASLLLLWLAPAVVFGESKMPSIGYTGAPTDHGGQDCSTCHNSFGAANSDTTGSLQVTLGNPNGYVPSVQQLIRIVVQNPNASRWGFQITIREQTDQTLTAGTFAAPSSMPEQVVCDDGSQFGAAAPCASSTTREFEEHMNAPRGNAGQAFEFDVSWTPPAQEVGRLIVYVAAVAANGDDQPTGDRVYTFSQIISNVGACALQVHPLFQNVVNGASFQSGFSSGAMVSIFGSGFQTSGNNRIAGLGDYVNGAFPTELGCASVQVTGGGLSSPALLPLAYVSPGQINAQMPVFPTTDPVMLTVLINPGSPNGVKSAVANITTLQGFAPAFFLFPNSMSIAAEEAHTFALVANPSVVMGASPAQPGDIVSLFGTGFGATNPAVAPGALASGTPTLPANSITVKIGSVTLASSDIQYAGLSPGSLSGLYQFNVRIPSGAGTGDVPVTITIGGQETQSGATIPIQ